jgi:dUTPase
MMTEAFAPQHHHAITLQSLADEQHAIQQLMGFNFAAMTRDERITYVKDMQQALTVEASEALNECAWKRWAVYPETDPPIKIETYTNELADILIFTINMMLAGQITANELARAVLAKIRINRQRIRSQYDGGWTRDP